MVFEPNRSKRIWIEIVTLGWDLIWIELLKLNPNPNPSPNPNPNPNRIHTHTHTKCSFDVLLQD